MNSKRKTTIVIGIIIGIVSLLLVSQSAHANRHFKVDVVGQGKRSMILIPGLTCPGEVWNETVERYKRQYTCHVISLPGFAGQPPIESEHYLQTLRDDIIAYIKENNLTRPIMVGHSLGGFLCLWISATTPDLVGANLIVDGLPFLPAAQNPAATVETSITMAYNMYKMMVNATPEQTKQSQQYFLPTMITGKDHYELISKWGVESHAPTVAKAMYELHTTDLRETITGITAPVTILGSWIGYKNYGVTKAISQEMFSAQFLKLPNKKILLSDNARHFIMFDDPQWFYEQMDQFLKTN